MVDQSADDIRYEMPNAAARAVSDLSAVDLVRLERIAKARAAGLGGVEWSDLLHEAFSRILAGTRRWPSHVPFVAFVAQTMRSLANEEWRQVKSQPFAGSGTSHLSGLPVDVEDDRPGADTALAARQFLDRILAAVEGDTNVLGLLSGHELGETAAQTMVRVGLTPREYDAARKRFRRTIDRLIAEHGTY